MSSKIQIYNMKRDHGNCNERKFVAYTFKKYPLPCICPDPVFKAYSLLRLWENYLCVNMIPHLPQLYDL